MGRAMLKELLLLALLATVAMSANEWRKKQIRKCMKENGATPKVLDLTYPPDIDILKYIAQFCINQTRADDDLISQALTNLRKLDKFEDRCWVDPKLSPQQLKQNERDLDVLLDEEASPCRKAEALTRYSCITVGRLNCGLSKEQIENEVPVHYARTFVILQMDAGNFSCPKGIPTPSKELYQKYFAAGYDPILTEDIDCSEFLNVWPEKATTQSTTTTEEPDDDGLHIFQPSSEESDEFYPKEEKDTVVIKNVRERGRRSD